MPMFATCQVKMERIILFMRNRESAFVFRPRVQSKVLWEFPTAQKRLIFVVERRLNLVPRASFPLTSGRKTRALGASISGMRHGYHTCRLRTAHACAVKPDMQNSVISIVIWKWMLPELSFSDRWSRGTKLWERDWSCPREVWPSYGHAHGVGVQSRYKICNAK